MPRLGIDYRGVVHSQVLLWPIYHLTGGYGVGWLCNVVPSLVHRLESGSGRTVTVARLASCISECEKGEGEESLTKPVYS